MFLTSRGSDISELLQLARFLRVPLTGSWSTRHAAPVLLETSAVGTVRNRQGTHLAESTSIPPTPPRRVSPRSSTPAVSQPELKWRTIWSRCAPPPTRSRSRNGSEGGEWSQGGWRANAIILRRLSCGATPAPQMGQLPRSPETPDRSFGDQGVAEELSVPVLVLGSGRSVR
jgi:hypothetical protein